MQTLPTVALIGRPNVGKSTLFNTLVGHRKSIVSDIPGTTRDMLAEKITPDDGYGETKGLWSYWLVDTAGLTNAKGDSLEQNMQLQTQVAIDQADILLFLIDAKKNLTQDDYDIVEQLRRSKKPVVLLANKVDDGNESVAYDLVSLGLGMPVVVSALNNFGLWELQSAVQEAVIELFGVLPIEDEKSELDEEDPADDVISVALVGRPNVGKSSLLNALFGQEKAIVSEVSGTTRDTVDVEITDDTGQKYLLLDSAGLRRPGKIGKDDPIEFWSSVRTQQAIERADICVALIDSLDGVTHQDMAIMGRVLDEHKGLIIGVNKFDLARAKARKETLEDEDEDEKDLSDVMMWGEDVGKIRERYLGYLRQRIEFCPWAPVQFFSAKTGKGVMELFETMRNIYAERQKRVSTTELNHFVPEVYYQHVQPSSGNKIGKIKYASQVDTHPPKFLFFVNNREAFHWSYKRYLENKLREKYGFFGTPIVIEFRDQMDKFRGKGE